MYAFTFICVDKGLASLHVLQSISEEKYSLEDNRVKQKKLGKKTRSETMNN